MVTVEGVVAASDYHQILRMLGPPNKLSRTDHGMTLLYEEVKLAERQGLNLAVKYVVLLKAIIARCMQIAGFFFPQACLESIIQTNV